MDWQTVRGFLEQFGYAAIALGTAIDQSGMQMFVVGGAALSRASDKLLLPGVMLAGMAGNLLADSIFYALGRWRAEWLKHFVRKPKAKQRLKLLHRWMKQHGPALVVFGRFFPWVGRFVPAVAGSQRVALWKVAVCSFVGSALAGATFGAIGYAAGSSVEFVGNWAGWVSLGIVLATIPLSIWALKRFDRRAGRELSGEDAHAPARDQWRSVVPQGAD